jgi:hypothetical protein
MHNVNLDTVIGYQKKNKMYSFLEEYDRFDENDSSGADDM